MVSGEIKGRQLFIPELEDNHDNGFGIVLLEIVISYHQTYPEGLVRLQERYWWPIIKGLEQRHNMKLLISSDLMPRKQPQETINTIEHIMKSLNSWHFAVLTCVATTAKSVLIGIAMLDGQLDGQTATQTARLETLSQTQLWGTMRDSHDLDEAYIKTLLTSARLFLRASPSS